MVSSYFPQVSDLRGPLLFVYPNGAPLSSRYLLNFVRSAFSLIGLDPRAISGHSFQKGGATSLSNAGVDDSIVPVLGDGNRTPITVTWFPVAPPLLTQHA